MEFGYYIIKLTQVLVMYDRKSFYTTG